MSKNIFLLAKGINVYHTVTNLHSRTAWRTTGMLSVDQIWIYFFMYCKINNWKKNQVIKKHVRFLPMILLHSFHVNRPLTLTTSIPVYTCTCTWMIFILHTVVSCQKSTNVKVFYCLNFMAGEMWKNVWWAARPLD